MFGAIVSTTFCSSPKSEGLSEKSDGAVNIQKAAKQIKNIRHAAAMGIGLGMVKVHKKMESNLLMLYNNFVSTVQNSKVSDNVAQTKLMELEKAIKRDKYAIDILQNGFDFAMNTKSVRNYRQTLNKMALNEKAKKPQNSIDSDVDVKKVQRNVQNHLKFMRDKVSSVRDALKKVESNKKPKIGFTSSKPTSQHAHMNGIFNHDIVRLPQLLVPMIYEIDVESFYRFRRQNDEESEDNNKIDTSKEKESQEDFDESFGPASETGGGGGGITGLIASLSGGEGGSDVGALIGAISGIITNLFGPGGLDLPSLISSGTSLLSGLLGKLIKNLING